MKDRASQGDLMESGDPQVSKENNNMTPVKSSDPTAMTLNNQV